MFLKNVKEKILQKIEVILAIALLIAFFLPWAKVFFFTGSGYNIGVHLGGEAKFVWAIPVAAIAIIALAFYIVDTKVMSIITGILPFVVFGRAYSEIGKDLFEILAIGAYISLFTGVLLILFGIGVIKSPSTVQVDETK